MYELSRCEDDAVWDSLLNQSPHSTPFCTSSYLKSTGQSESRYILTHKNIPVLLSILTRGQGGRLQRQFSDYQGVMTLGTAPGNYSDDLLLINHVRELLKLAIIDQNDLEFSLNPNFFDIRAFQWFAFDNSAEIEMSLKVRYTGIIDLTTYKNFEDFLKKISKSRLRDFLSNTTKLVTSINQPEDIQTFIQMYTETFSSQGVVLAEETINKVLAIITNGINSDIGELRLVRTTQREVVSGVFFLKSNDGRFYQFGASSELKNKFPGNSVLILEAIRDSFASEHKFFDISGLNSPKRGFFKVSFGARPKPFFEIQLRRI
jgi:hypothetical protein